MKLRRSYIQGEVTCKKPEHLRWVPRGRKERRETERGKQWNNRVFRDRQSIVRRRTLASCRNSRAGSCDRDSGIIPKTLDPRATTSAPSHHQHRSATRAISLSFSGIRQHQITSSSSIYDPLSSSLDWYSSRERCFLSSLHNDHERTRLDIMIPVVEAVTQIRYSQ